MDIGTWIGIIVVGVCIIYFGMYFIVKKATKDALKEYYKENADKQGNGV